MPSSVCESMATRDAWPQSTRTMCSANLKTDLSVLKKCSTCKTILPTDGPTRCPPCATRNADRQKAKRLADPEAMRAKARAWLAKNRERVNRERRERYSRLGISRARTRSCIGCGLTLKRKGPHRCPVCLPIHQKQYYEAKNAKWVRENPMQNRTKRARRRARLLNAPGSYTVDEWLGLKARYNHACLCCRRREPHIKLEPDHVIPIARGGHNTIDNIQPLCRSCNSSKKAKTIDYRQNWSG